MINIGFDVGDVAGIGIQIVMAMVIVLKASVIVVGQVLTMGEGISFGGSFRHVEIDSHALAGVVGF